MEKYAIQYMHKHHIESVEEFLGSKRNWATPRILSTIGGSSAAYAAFKYFGIDYSISNEDKFGPDYKLIGVDLLIKNGEEKLSATIKLLDKLGIKITECSAVGDSSNDIPILKSVRFRYASPFATEDVKKLPNIVQLRT